MTRLWYNRGDFERWSAQAQQLGYEVRIIRRMRRVTWLAEYNGKLIGVFSKSRTCWLDVDDPRVLQ